MCSMPAGSGTSRSTCASRAISVNTAENCFGAGRPILSCASALCDRLYVDLTYAPGETTISTSVIEVLQRKRGVCQDFAHLMIACLRSRGLPARYVSGYVRTIRCR